MVVAILSIALIGFAAAVLLAFADRFLQIGF